MNTQPHSLTNSHTDFITELKDLPETSTFRFQNQKCLLTYKTHISKESFFAWIHGRYGVRKMYIAHENGKDDPITPYEHTHAVIDFGRRIDSKNSRLFDFGDIHPHISLIKTPTEWLKACKYICKEDKSVQLDTRDKFNDATSCWANNSLSDALQNCKLNEVTNTIALFKCKPMELPEPEISEEMFYDWQKDVWNMIQLPPNGRSVDWIFDGSGNSGKTRFAKWVCLKHPEKAVMLNNVGKISDFAMNMQNFWNSGWRGDTVFLNLSRSYADKQHLYEALEIIADGYITCTKYTGGICWLPPMHIVVFANFEPQCEKLSKDRWNIKEIWDKGLHDVKFIGAAIVTLSKESPPPFHPFGCEL